MTQVHISRFPDDKECMRASIGGVEGEGYYLVMRLHEYQSQSDMIQMLEGILEVLKQAPPLEIEQPSPGKFGSGASHLVTKNDKAFTHSLQLLVKAIYAFKEKGFSEIGDQLIKEALHYGIKIEIKE